MPNKLSFRIGTLIGGFGLWAWAPSLLTDAPNYPVSDKITALALLTGILSTIGLELLNRYGDKP